MCVVLQHNLGKGTRWPRPRCIPPGCWCSRGIEPLVAPAKRIAVLSLAGGDFALLLHHHRPRGLGSPMEPSIRGEKLALPSEHPINQRLENCLSTWTKPCTNDWPFDRQLGERFCCPQLPMAPSSARTRTADDQKCLVYAFGLKATFKRGIDKLQ